MSNLNKICDSILTDALSCVCTVSSEKRYRKPGQYGMAHLPLTCEIRGPKAAIVNIFSKLLQNPKSLAHITNLPVTHGMTWEVVSARL